jgi:hypothetical protein
MSRLNENVDIGALLNVGGRTKVRAHHGWPCQRVRQGIKRDISDAGEQRIGYFGWMHNDVIAENSHMPRAPSLRAAILRSLLSLFSSFFPWSYISSIALSSRDTNL